MFYSESTVKLYELLNNSEVKSKIDEALSHYPLYVAKNETNGLIPDREALNQRLLDYYKYRSIGFETIGRFIDELRIAMNHIMPYYNQLYKTVDTMEGIEDIFGNVDIVETYKETRKDSATSTGTSSNTSTSSDNSTTSASGQSTSTSEAQTGENGVNNHELKYSDTPQSKVSDIDNYLTNYTKENTSTENTSTSEAETTTNTNSDTTVKNTSSSEGSGTSTATSEGSGTVEHTFTKKGNQGVNTYAHDMLEFRDTLLDVTAKIITDSKIAELFMLVF